MRKQPDTLKYGLEDVVPRQELPLYTLQHIVYFAAGIIVLPIAVGLYLGLSQGKSRNFYREPFSYAAWLRSCSLVLDTGIRLLTDRRACGRVC